MAWQLTMPAQAREASPTLPAGVVAAVNDEPITESEVGAVLQASNQPDTPDARNAVKARLIARTLIRQAAEHAGYGSKPEVQAAAQTAKSDAEIQSYLNENVKPAPVTDAQVKASYDAFVASLGKYEYKPRVIVFSDAAKAEAVMKEIKAGKPFDALAREYSVAPSHDAGGELPWMSLRTPVQEGRTSGLPLGIAGALANLEVGKVKFVPVAGNGIVGAIVKLDAKRPTQVPAFSQAQESIRSQLQAHAFAQANSALVGELMDRATIRQ
ncbi:peptidyl-prolyl cis-trans isomerase [Burkholderia cenocepacia]|nr:peptidylprolyl isomerase [Burkholderia cenocepacia]QUN38661.1 peptidyl-prolyl cis-trans isomerase [Burkholderia cenocepacia]QUO29436.1 peptidyl-prolyl cis-trans isomerase [Burkholderia cenocepacia]